MRRPLPPAPAARHRRRSAADGRLSIGGVRPARPGRPSSARRCSSTTRPTCAARCREAVAAFGDGVAYATKAFLCVAMARLAHEEGMHLDVATGGELHVALAAGVPADRLVLHGNNKSLDELRHGARATASAASSSTASTSSTASSALHAEDGRVPEVLVRVTPGVEAHTHEFVPTGQDDSKFGFGVAVGRRRRAPSSRAPDSPAVELVGVHVHIGSQVFVADFFDQAVEVLAPFVRELRPARAVDRRRARRRLRRGRGRRRRSPSGARRSATACRDAGHRPPASPPSRAGRSRPRPAITLYTVGTIKDLPGIRTYVSVDGGMSDNPRPVLYGSGYETFLPRAVDGRPARAGHASSASTASRATCWCATRRCPPTSPSATSSPRRSPAPTATRWAPTTTRCPRPAVVFVRDGEARVVVRRETLDDLLRHDVV